MSTSLNKPGIGSTDWGSDVNDNWTTLEAAINLLRGYIDGLVLSNNGTDANNDIDIASGMARDASNSYSMALNSALTKQLDAAWAVGNNQGGLDTGSKAANTWYHVWLIMRSDTGNVDVLFSTSATSPTMPANYDVKRRIGAIRTNGSNNIRSFIQYQDTFLFKDSILDASSSSFGTTATLYTLTTPGGIIVEAILTVFLTAGIANYYIVNPPGRNDNAPLYNGNAGGIDLQDNVNKTQPWTRVFTNTSSQIRFRGTGTMTIWIHTFGWVDPRGKNA